MTREDIIAMAREAAQMPQWSDRALEVYGLRDMAMLERFAALVADAEAKRMHDEGMVTIGHMRQQIAAEREACAKVCDRMAVRCNDIRAAALESAAENIRARGQA